MAAGSPLPTLTPSPLVGERQVDDKGCCIAFQYLVSRNWHLVLPCVQLHQVDPPTCRPWEMLKGYVIMAAIDAMSIDPVGSFSFRASLLSISTPR